MLRWRIFGYLTIAFVLAASPDLASASTLPYADTVLVRGTQLDVIELDIERPGTYDISVVDLELLNQPLNLLSFTVFRDSEALAEPVTGSGALALYIGAAGRSFLQIYARTATATSYGLYSVNVYERMVVALPASLYMLLSGLGLLYPAWRRRLALRASERAPRPA